MRNIIMFAIFSLCIALSSCNKEEVLGVQEETTAMDATYEFSKDVTLRKAGNTAVIRIHSDNAALLGEYSTESFDLVPVGIGQTPEEALQASGIATTGSEENPQEIAPPPMSESKAPIAYELVSKHLASGTQSYLINFKQARAASRSSWNYATHYSQPNIDINANIMRTSSWNRVYYGVYYKPTSTSGFSTVVSAWTLLRNNDPETWRRENCYILRVNVAYKSAGNYSVWFN